MYIGLSDNVLIMPTPPDTRRPANESPETKTPNQREIFRQSLSSNGQKMFKHLTTFDYFHESLDSSDDQCPVGQVNEVVCNFTSKTNLAMLLSQVIF